MILLHGVTNSVEDWLLNFHVLPENYRAYAVDLIGHGKTDKPLSVSYRVKDLACFITAFMDVIQVEKVHLIGHSLGGMISFYLAMDFPVYVDQLVVVSSAGLSKWLPMFMRLITVPVVGELLGAMMANEDFDQHLKSQRKNWPNAMVATDELIRLRYETKDWDVMTKPILKLFRTIANFYGVKEREYLPVVQGLPSIRNPLLVVWGRQDALAPVANTQVIAENVPPA